MVGAVQVVDGPGLVGRRREQVEAEGDVGLVVAQMAQHGGHDVGLLGDGVVHAGGDAARGVEEDDGRRESAQVGLVFGVVALVGVVAGQDEQRMFVPRLLPGLPEELCEGMVGVAYHLVNGQLLLAVDVAVGLRHLEGVMARQGEEGRHEGLLHGRHRAAEVLQERLVVDAPHAVVAGRVGRCGLEVLTTVIVGKACGTCEGQEAHRPAGRSVEEGRRVALAAEAVGQSGDVVDAVGREEERLDEHGNRREDAWHAVDRLAAVAVAAGERGAVLDERVGEGRVAFVSAVLQGSVERADIFAAEALDDQYDHILLGHDYGVGRQVQGRIDGVELLGCEVGRHLEVALADGSDEREGRVEHDADLGRPLAVGIGIRQRDGTHLAGPSAAHAGDAEGGENQKRQQHDRRVGQSAHAPGIEPRHAVEPPERDGHDDGQEHQIPVGNQFVADDGREVAFVGKLIEHGGRRAPHGEGKVDYVAQVDGQRQRVDRNE